MARTKIGAKMRLPKTYSVALIFVLATSLVAQQTPIVADNAAPHETPVLPTVPPHTLLDGTPVKLRIGRNVSSADAKIGEHVDFEVLDEVQVMGVIVIAKGATASATVTDAQSKRRMGRAGRLDLTLDYVRLVDDEKAALTANAGGKGGSHTGAMVGAMAATAIFTLGGSALFLLMHGKDITIPKGAETTAYIRGDMHLDMAKFVTPPSPATTQTGNATLASTSQPAITVESNPPGADIEIDGAFVGNTPSTINLALGSHDIAVKKKGFTDWSKKLNVTGGSIHLNAELEAEPPK
jgi:hypothetical protein